MIKVKATNKFKELKVPPRELSYIPEVGTVFEIAEERLHVLMGDNPFNACFVEPVKEVKKNTKKKTK